MDFIHKFNEAEDKVNLFNDESFGPFVIFMFVTTIDGSALPLSKLIELIRTGLYENFSFLSETIISTEQLKGFLLK